MLRIAFPRLAAFLAALLVAMPAMAQSWPDRPLKFIVSAPAGSSLDVLARTIADKLKDRLGQPVVVEDRPAAGGTAATDFVAKSAPDGYTMVISFNGPLAFGPHLYSKLPYDPLKDLAPVIITSSQPSVLAVNAGLPVKSVKELVEYAKANPGKLNYASVGNGSSSQLTMELLKTTAGVDIVHVPFNGSPPAVTATIQGETQMLFAVMQPLQAQIQAGKLRAIAVTTAKRFPLLPDIPTIAEAGYPGFEALAWNGILVAAGTPRPIIQRLNTEINAILKEPAVKSALQRAGLRPDRRCARGLRQSDPRRIRKMGAGDPQDRRQDRLIRHFLRANDEQPMIDAKKIVLAYSGGLDTSVILKWLQDTYRCEIVTFTADIGQGDELEPARTKAAAAGVKQIFIDDLREEFVRDFVFPMFRANAIYEGEYLLGTSIARPLIAKRQIEIARETGADAVSHGATGKGNDQVRFELGYYALEPDIKVIAPWREWDLMSREKLLAYAEKHGIPIEMKHRGGGSPYSMDANLLHISYEGRALEDPAQEAEEDMWRWTVSPEKAPDRAEYVELEYRQGDIVAINGKTLIAREGADRT